MPRFLEVAKRSQIPEGVLSACAACSTSVTPKLSIKHSNSWFCSQPSMDLAQSLRSSTICIREDR